MQRHACNFTALLLILICVRGLQSQDAKAEIQQRLAAQFVLTKTTADRSDIVTPGSVLALKKDGLIMFTLDARVPAITTYKDGKLSMGFGDAMAITLALGSNQTASTVPQRKFVAGEKFWITAYSVTDKHIMLVVYSDPFNDVRYYGQIKFPFQKHNIPSADEAMKTIAEVVDVQAPGQFRHDRCTGRQRAASRRGSRCSEDNRARSKQGRSGRGSGPAAEGSESRSKGNLHLRRYEGNVSQWQGCRRSVV